MTNGRTPTVWYKLPKNKAHELLEPYLSTLETQFWNQDILAWERFLRMYGDNSYIGILPSRIRGGRGFSNVFDPSLTWNVTRNLIKTAQAKICSAKPRPRFQTSAGSSKSRQNAKKLQKLIDAIFQQSDVYTVASEAFLDACIFGSGFLKVLRKDGVLRAERVLISEILVDKTASYINKPQQLTHRKEVPRESLKDSYPKHEAEIDLLTSVTPLTGARTIADNVVVKETWLLPENDQPGRHVVTIPGATLLDEEYNFSEFPIVKIDWSKLSVGYFGNGIPAEVFGIQLTINKILQQIVMCQDAMAWPRILVPIEGKINTNAINDKLGQLIHYASGMKPEFITSQAMPAEVYNFLSTQYSKAYELTGLSQQVAQARKEPGITSGIALQEVSEIQSDRLNKVSQSYERLFLELANRFIDLAKETADKYPEFEVQLRTQIGLEVIQLDEIDLSSKYDIELAPSNLLSILPAGRLQRVSDLLQLGLLQPQEAKHLLSDPDVDAYFNDSNAAEDIFAKQIDLIIDNGVFIPPEEIDELELGIDLYKKAYFEGRLNGLEPEKLELIYDWIAQAQTLLDQAQQSQQPQQPNQPNQPNPQQAPGPQTLQ